MKKLACLCCDPSFFFLPCLLEGTKQRQCQNVESISPPSGHRAAIIKKHQPNLPALSRKNTSGLKASVLRPAVIGRLKVMSPSYPPQTHLPSPAGGVHRGKRREAHRSEKPLAVLTNKIITCCQGSSLQPNYSNTPHLFLLRNQIHTITSCIKHETCGLSIGQFCGISV